MLEISNHDLHRLLLQFRLEVARRPKGQNWYHDSDYDASFERLADIVNAARIASGRETDPRIRCNHKDAAYVWPQAYKGQWINIRDTGGAAPQRTGRHIGHLLSRRGADNALCGYLYSSEDIIRKPARPYEKCLHCIRESELRDNVTVIH